MFREGAGGTGESSWNRQGMMKRETRSQALRMGSPHLPTGDPVIFLTAIDMSPGMTGAYSSLDCSRVRQTVPN